MFRPCVTIGSARWVVLGILLVVAAIVPLRSTASVPLPPGGLLGGGTTAAHEPDLVGPIVNNIFFPFVIRNAQGAVMCQGRLQNYVVRSNQTHDLHFYYHLTGLRGGGRMLSVLTAVFPGPVFVDWRADQLPGTVPPVRAARVGGSLIQFFFQAPGLLCEQSAGESRPFFIKTTAQRFKPAGQTTLFATGGKTVIPGTFEPQ